MSRELLQQALAQPDAEPVTWRWRERPHESRAWGDWHHVGHRPQWPITALFQAEPLYATPPTPATFAKCDGGTCGLGGYCADCPKQQPAPAVREPLTEREIDDIWDGAHRMPNDTIFRVFVTRAIERAHGITGDSNDN